MVLSIGFVFCFPSSEFIKSQTPSNLFMQALGGEFLRTAMCWLVNGRRYACRSCYYMVG